MERMVRPSGHDPFDVADNNGLPPHESSGRNDATTFSGIHDKPDSVTADLPRATRSTCIDFRISLQHRTFLPCFGYSLLYRHVDDRRAIRSEQQKARM
ncbi:hypothetical protein [Kibdelosporangium philippinense]|uniref:hypothetical protein n=1 Tax=Kibdelosporangium philippinense TaxID=211113 RepID=UPI00360B6913